MLRRQTLVFRSAVAALGLVYHSSAIAEAVETTSPTTVAMVPQLVHATESHDAGIISPDGRYAASVHRGLVHLWDLESGALLQVNSAEGAQATLAFSGNGQTLRFITSTSAGFFVHAWNVKTNETTKQKTNDVILALASGIPRAFMRDWKSAGIEMLDLESGKSIRSFAPHSAPRPSIMTHDPHQVASIVVSQRGDIAMLERWDGAIECWDLERGVLRFKEEQKSRSPHIAVAQNGIRAIFGRPAQGKTKAELVVLDTAKGSILRSIPLPSSPQGMAISPTGKQAWVLTGGKGRQFDLESGTELRSEAIPIVNVRTLKYANENQFLWSSSGRFEIRNALDWKLQRSFTEDKPSLASNEAVVFTNGARELSVVDDEGSRANLIRWDLARLGLQQAHTFVVPGDMARMNANGTRAWFKNSMLSVVTLQNKDFDRREFKMDWATFQLRPTPVLPWGDSTHAIVDAKRIGVDLATKKPVSDYVISELDATTGSKIDRVVEPWPAQGEQLLAAVSNDGRHVAVRSFDLTTRTADLKVWDLQTGKLKRLLELDSLTLPTATFLSGDRIAVAYLPKDAGSTWTVALFDLRTGSASWSAKYSDSVAQTMRVSPDESRLAVAGKTIAIFDAKTSATIGTWAGDAEVVEGLSFSSDNNYLAAGGRSGVTTLHRLDKNTNVHMLTSGNEWLVYSDDGYFDASRKGGSLIAAVNDLQAYRIDQLAVRNNRPDILLERMGLGTPDIIAHFKARYKRRLEKLGIRSESSAPTFTTTPEVLLDSVDISDGYATIHFAARARGADLLRYNIYVNDVPLFGPLGKVTSGRHQKIDERIELGLGRNKIEIGALDAQGAESLRAMRTVEHTGKADKDLYYLAFGVSRYKNPQYNLGYPHKDVTDLGDVLRSGKGKAFRNVYVRTYIDKDATAENLRKAKTFFKDAGVEDTVVLFIAGHGLHDHDAEANYYFATHEVDPRQLAKTAARFDVIEDLLLDIRARKKLFLMDTCESGEREENDAPSNGIPGASRGLTARSKRALALDIEQTQSSRPTAPFKATLLDRNRYIYNDLLRRTGAVVISSSRGSEFSYELPEIENGVFTEEMLRALTSDVADHNHDGTISTEELRAHLASAVPARTDDQQHPTVDRDNLEASFGFPVVKEAAAIVNRPASDIPQSMDTTVPPPSEKPPVVNHPQRGCACEVATMANEGSSIFSILLGSFVLRIRRRRKER